MTLEASPDERSFLDAVARLVGRPLDERETRLASSLRHEKSAEVVARELEAAPVKDPKKIRPEHVDTANE